MCAGESRRGRAMRSDVEMRMIPMRNPGAHKRRLLAAAGLIGLGVFTASGVAAHAGEAVIVRFLEPPGDSCKFDLRGPRYAFAFSAGYGWTPRYRLLRADNGCAGYYSYGYTYDPVATILEEADERVLARRGY